MNGLATCKHLEAVRLALSETPQAAAWHDPEQIARGDLSDLDVVVFDLETQRLFQDVGGYRNTARLFEHEGEKGFLQFQKRNGSTR